jgi:hypothetical protein
VSFSAGLFDTRQSGPFWRPPSPWAAAADPHFHGKAGWRTERLAKAWHRACARTEIETGLLHLPEVCPWSIAQVLDKDFLP